MARNELRGALILLPYFPFLSLYILDTTSFFNGPFLLVCISSMFTQFTLTAFWTALRGSAHIEQRMEGSESSRLVFGSNYRTSMLTIGLLITVLELFALYSLQDSNLSLAIIGILLGFIFAIYALCIPSLFKKETTTNTQKYPLALFSKKSFLGEAGTLFAVGLVLIAAFAILITVIVSIE